ncbi:protease modulator HflC [Sulfitobacter sp. 1A12779]|uniref:protease modulator HflC n=1 Tax=Sulfitobacter sp. 1A12779 TaxID=3368599 RepID=UPI00374626FB
MRKTSLIIPIVVIAIVGILSAVFVVDEREKALVLRFGQIKQVRNEPGIGFKVPLLDEVVRYEDRILSLETPVIEVTPADDRRLEIDAFVLYRIDDMVQYRQALGAGGERQAESEMGGIMESQIRAVLGSQGVTSNTILSPERADLMEQIRVRADARAQALGLKVVDVRLRQTNLPEQNFDATLQRMIAEREREATDERARGREAAQRVIALADRTYEEILSEARRDARIIEGEADAQRNNIFAQAYGKDQEFFEFYRSLSAYEQALQGQNSTMVMSPDSEFFNYLRSDRSATTSVDAVAPPQSPAADAPAAEPAPEADNAAAAEDTQEEAAPAAPATPAPAAPEADTDLPAALEE